MKQKAVKKDRNQLIKHYIPDIVVLLRILIAVILLVLAYKLKVTTLVSLLMLIIAGLAVGLDTLIYAVNAAIKGDYFNENCLVSVAAVAVFAAGCFTEAVVFLAVYKLCIHFMRFVRRFAERTALELIPADNKDFYSRMRAKLAGKDAEKGVSNTKQIVLLAVKVLCGVAVVFALIMPLVTDMTYLMSVRRGAMIIAALAPVSLFASENLIFVLGHCFASSYNVYFSGDTVFEDVSELGTVAFDKTDVITGGNLKVTAVASPVLPKESFLMAAAYTVFSSDQPFALPVISAYNGEIVSDLVRDFTDIQSLGCEAKISGAEMLFGTKELMDLRGVEIDDSQLKSGYVFYLAISGKLAGSITFKENINPYAQQTISDLADMGIESVLISSDSEEISKKTAEILNISRFFSGCDSMKKLKALKSIKDNDVSGSIMYISADSLDYHTDADIDVKVGSDSGERDILMSNIGIYGLPLITDVSGRMKRIKKQNLILALAVKLILLVLAFTGFATLWFVILLDYSAGMFGLINAVEISNAIIPKDEQL